MDIPTERSQGRPPTPPHHPTYGVRLSDDEIKALIVNALQVNDVETIKQLPSGESFNNRIYFITPSSKSRTNHDLVSNGVVLKIPGWNFGVDKIQNEVISLLLLEKHCPQIPVPRVLAWFEGGENIQRVQRVHDYATSAGDQHSLDASIINHGPGEISQIEKSRAWILMTRLPGQTLQPSHIEPHKIDGVMKQLAEYMSQWRKIPAPTQHIGNLRFVGPGSENITFSEGTSTLIYGRRIGIHGLLIGSAPLAMCSSQEYYTAKIRGELAILKNNENYAPNRASLVPLIEEFLRDSLPQTSIFGLNQGHYAISVFTHYDLSPRNILVSLSTSGKLQLSGIVDFEFSGFFPSEEEFTNTSVQAEGDWPSQAWSSFIEYLESSGVRVPQGKLWNEACALVRIIDNIAPWQLRESGLKGEALDLHLQQARLKIEENVQLLKRS
jgi:hypothetical protein